MQRGTADSAVQQEAEGDKHGAETQDFMTELEDKQHIAHSDAVHRATVDDAGNQ